MPAPTPAWHGLEVQDAATRLATDPTSGLPAAEAERRLEQHGPNELERVGRRSWLAVLASQFVDVLILILLLAAGVSLAIGHATDAATIIAIVLLNGALGFAQEWRAELSLDALRRMLTPDSKVIRDGAQRIVPTRELVPGDLVARKSIHVICKVRDNGTPPLTRYRRVVVAIE